MDETNTAGASAPADDGGFFGGVNSFLGAVNNFGVTAANVRDRFRRPSSSTDYAVPVGQGSQPGRIAAVNEVPGGSFKLSMPAALLLGSVALVLVVVALKLRG